MTLSVERSSERPRLDPQAVAPVVDVLYDRVRGDESLGSWFDGADLARVRAHQVQLLVALAAEPADGDDHLADLAGDLAAAHAQLAIDHAAFDRVAGHLAAALQEVGVADVVARSLLQRVSALRPHVVVPAPSHQGEPA